VILENFKFLIKFDLLSMATLRYRIQPVLFDVIIIHHEFNFIFIKFTDLSNFMSVDKRLYLPSELILWVRLQVLRKSRRCRIVLWGLLVLRERSLLDEVVYCFIYGVEQIAKDVRAELEASPRAGSVRY
jgi:hypothetical protein